MSVILVLSIVIRCNYASYFLIQSLCVYFVMSICCIILGRFFSLFNPTCTNLIVDTLLFFCLIDNWLYGNHNKSKYLYNWSSLSSHRSYLTIVSWNPSTVALTVNRNASVLTLMYTPMQKHTMHLRSWNHQIKKFQTLFNYWQ